MKSKVLFSKIFNSCEESGEQEKKKKRKVSVSSTLYNMRGCTNIGNRRMTIVQHFQYHLKTNTMCHAQGLWQDVLCFIKRCLWKDLMFLLLLLFWGFFSMAEPTAYASFQARDQVQATARSLTHCARLGNKPNPLQQPKLLQSDS